MDKLNKAYEWVFGGSAYGLTGFGIYFNWADLKGNILFVVAVIMGFYQITYWRKKSKGLLK
jgi:hypothetical protein